MADVIPLIPIIPPSPRNLEQVRALTTTQLKYMWDEQSDRYEHLWEDIHRVMNERGEGRYVAV